MVLIVSSKFHSCPEADKEKRDQMRQKLLNETEQFTQLNTNYLITGDCKWNQTVTISKKNHKQHFIFFIKNNMILEIMPVNPVASTHRTKLLQIVNYC